ncbi:MAG TPA: hypothetical protein VKY90_16650 [Candidatus Dormibacteraeota bacterium]|nr:hypothetical protein [Candidatus Dormibacteraeota bacterium]
MPEPEPLRYLDLINRVTADLPPMPVATLGPPVLTPLAPPLARARVIIVTSAGVRLASDPPFERTNDLSFRRIDAGVGPELLVPSHPTPVRAPAERDVNVVFPYQRLRELAVEGTVGEPPPYHLSFLGTIKKLTALVTGPAMAMAAAAREAGADAALLVPL